MTVTELESLLSSLVGERRTLSARIQEVEQKLLAAKSSFKIGDTIEWSGPLGNVKRGVVRTYKTWCGGIAYGVKRLRKDGSIGAAAMVYPYDKPKASSVAYTEQST